DAGSVAARWFNKRAEKIQPATLSTATLHRSAHQIITGFSIASPPAVAAGAVSTANATRCPLQEPRRTGCEERAHRESAVRRSALHVGLQIAASDVGLQIR